MELTAKELKKILKKREQKAEKKLGKKIDQKKIFEHLGFPSIFKTLT